MLFLRKNIWLVFFILTFFFALYFVFASYVRSQLLVAQTQSSQENTVKLLDSATQALYKTNEVMLDILGYVLLIDAVVLDNQEAIATLDAALESSPAIISIAILDPQGNFLFATNDRDITNFPNLLEQPETRDSFLETMNSEQMVFGRGYLFEPFGEWIVPIRKAIRNSDGSVYRVISAAMRLEDSFGHIVKSYDQHNRYHTMIVRSDMFVQYDSNRTESDYSIYENPVSDLKQQAIQKAMENGRFLVLDQNSASTIPITLIHTINGTDKLITFLFNRDYDLWYMLMTDMARLWAEIWRSIAIYFLIFVIVEGLMFALFRIIAQADEKRRADLLYQATHDQLTGLLNRNYLIQNIQDWIFPNAHPFGLLYIDLDNFKNINDSYGHYLGDLLLQQLSQRLTNVLPLNSALIRYGGDEFIILTALHEDTDLMDLAKKIIDKVLQPYKINCISLHVGASVGIAKYPQHGKDLNDLLRGADIAMYESKRFKNTARFFQDSMQEQYLRMASIEQSLRSAMENREIFMVYQPQIASDGSFYGVEALARWASPQLGNLSPLEFIPVAEMSGLMPLLGRYILDCCLTDISYIKRSLGMDFQSSINISALQLLESEFSTYVLKLLDQEGLENFCLTLELTESFLIEDLDQVLPRLNEFKHHGLQLSLDDFGTGYSSLNMLRLLPIDELKIDKSFVDVVLTDLSAHQMLQNIVSIGKNFNMDVVAEGIESKEQLDVLTKMGCDRFQGFYFAQPMDKEALVQFILKKHGGHLKN
jgi:diguanylate cyclase (GGDEF)-like protein